MSRSATITSGEKGSMSIPNTKPMHRRPIHPGEMLRERRAVSPEMALRLSRLFGNSPEFWLNAQCAVDLWGAAQKLKGRSIALSRFVSPVVFSPVVVFSPIVGPRRLTFSS